MRRFSPPAAISIGALIITGLYSTWAQVTVLPALAALAGPLAADALLGYYFAGRQLIFALPFLVLLAGIGAQSVPRWASAMLLLPLLAASLKIDFRQATVVREDWATPADRLAASGGCIYVWGPDQLSYFRVYHRSLQQCDLKQQPAEFWHVTTRYSPPTEHPEGYVLIRSEQVGVAKIALYRRDASLKTYGFSRFIFRTQIQHHRT